MTSVDQRSSRKKTCFFFFFSFRYHHDPSIVVELERKCFEYVIFD